MDNYPIKYKVISTITNVCAIVKTKKLGLVFIIADFYSGAEK